MSDNSTITINGKHSPHIQLRRNKALKQVDGYGTKMPNTMGVNNYIEIQTRLSDRVYVWSKELG